MTETVTIELDTAKAMTAANLLREDDDNHNHDFCEETAEEMWEQIREQVTG